MKTNGTAPTGDDRTRSGKRSYSRERLLRDAGSIDEKDIDELHESIPRKLQSLELEKLDESVGWITTFLDKVKMLYSMIFDKEYHLPTKTKLLIGAALIYFVLPTDVVPDFIPGVGYLDDAVILSALWRMIGTQIEEYTEYMRSR